nr:hypothetical protein [uncultured Rhodopila sp.]
MNYQYICDNAMGNRKATVGLLNGLGLNMTYMQLAQLDHRGKGPKQTIVNGDIMYRIADVREWLEKRLKMPIRRAVEVGLLRVPTELEGKLLWYSDDKPVKRLVA